MIKVSCYYKVIDTRSNAMKEYIGTKIIGAEPAPYSGDKLSEIGKMGYKVIYPDGYESWSPKSAFEMAYREIDRMTFENALYMLKRGSKVTREGWNGKGLYVIKESVLTSFKPFEDVDQEGKSIKGLSAISNPCFILVDTINDKSFTWVPSITDLFAEDWSIVK